MVTTFSQDTPQAGARLEKLVTSVTVAQVLRGNNRGDLFWRCHTDGITATLFEVNLLIAAGYLAFDDVKYGRWGDVGKTFTLEHPIPVTVELVHSPYRKTNFWQIAGIREEDTMTNLTPEQKAQVHAFVKSELERYPLIECEQHDDHISFKMKTEATSAFQAKDKIHVPIRLVKCDVKKGILSGEVKYPLTWSAEGLSGYGFPSRTNNGELEVGYSTLSTGDVVTLTGESIHLPDAVVIPKGEIGVITELATDNDGNAGTYMIRWGERGIEASAARHEIRHLPNTPRPITNAERIEANKHRLPDEAESVDELEDTEEHPAPADIDAGSHIVEQRHFDSQLVKIGEGSTDTGAFHRAIVIARELFNRNIWDGSTEIFINNPQPLHDDIFGIGKRSIEDLVEGTDYEFCQPTPRHNSPTTMKNLVDELKEKLAQAEAERDELRREKATATRRADVAEQERDKLKETSAARESTITALHNENAKQQTQIDQLKAQVEQLTSLIPADAPRSSEKVIKYAFPASEEEATRIYNAGYEILGTSIAPDPNGNGFVFNIAYVRPASPVDKPSPLKAFEKVFMGKQQSVPAAATSIIVEDPAAATLNQIRTVTGSIVPTEPKTPFEAAWEAAERGDISFEQALRIGNSQAIESGLKVVGS